MPVNVEKMTIKGNFVQQGCGWEKVLDYRVKRIDKTIRASVVK